MQPKCPTQNYTELSSDPHLHGSKLKFEDERDWRVSTVSEVKGSDQGGSPGAQSRGGETEDP